MEKTTEQLLQELISKFSTFLEKVDITTFSIAEKLKTHRDFIESMSGDIGTLNGNIDLLCTRVTKLEQSQKTVKEQSEQAADLAERLYEDVYTFADENVDSLCARVTKLEQGQQAAQPAKRVADCLEYVEQVEPLVSESMLKRIKETVRVLGMCSFPNHECAICPRRNSCDAEEDAVDIIDCLLEILGVSLNE